MFYLAKQERTFEEQTVKVKCLAEPCSWSYPSEWSAREEHGSFGQEERERGREMESSCTNAACLFAIVLSCCEWEEIWGIQLMLSTLQNKVKIIFLVAYLDFFYPRVKEYNTIYCSIMLY